MLICMNEGYLVSPNYPVETPYEKQVIWKGEWIGPMTKTENRSVDLHAVQCLGKPTLVRDHHERLESGSV